ncbi:thiamine pyrophosphate-binding protein [Afifella sp. IM 167]|uniref:thiamine pyrophosphate-binding protein n=1 Tax=Afifella sp. IM 167 TaxID=2033586 RepID=UPI001CCFFBC5|nr:thiamine pyrophosphate-binding protein [Afifella sp. IM 167]MBZ8135402.1 decarboxylase [Afifella sp. IM 167]
MLAVEGRGSVADAGWHETLIEVFKGAGISLVTYVPDNVLRPLIDGVHADPYFNVVPTTREEEAVGIASGSIMAGVNAAVLMQTSGLATLANVLASLPSVYQIPVVMVVSERGVLGEFNRGQALVAKTMRPILDSAGVDHCTIRRGDELRFMAERTILQALYTRTPAALILSPLLTGGKTIKK